MKRIILAALAIFGFAATAQAQSNTWRAVDAPGFRFEMPGPPKHTTDTGKLEEGPVVSHAYLFDEGGAGLSFTATTEIYPPALQLPEPKESIQIMADSAKEDMDGGTWTTFRFAAVGGVPAAYGTGTQDGRPVFILMSVKGRQAVMLTFKGVKDAAMPAEATHFIDSLKFK